MTKKHRQNGAGWNKNQSQGVKTHFKQAETGFLAGMFLNTANWHDLAMFLTALDTALRACDLLKMKVSDVCYSNGQVRQKLARRQQKTSKPVEPVLTPDTRQALAMWIGASGKRRDEFLFTRTKKGRDAGPITRVHLSRLVKKWAEWLGHPPDDYACHSLRRTRGVQMYEAGERVADVSKMYGHSSETSTLHYLGITQQRVTEMCLRHGLELDFNAIRDHRPMCAQAQIGKPAPEAEPKYFCPNAAKT